MTFLMFRLAIYFGNLFQLFLGDTATFTNSGSRVAGGGRGGVAGNAQPLLGSWAIRAEIWGHQCGRGRQGDRFPSSRTPV